jgi:RNA polymerase sigma-70 factor (ECF subfamily)
MTAAILTVLHPSGRAPPPRAALTRGTGDARGSLLPWRRFGLCAQGALSAMTSSASRFEPEPPAARAADPARLERDARLAALLRASARGDASAFESFYDATVGYAQALARRVLRGADTEDLLADVYFEAWRTAARHDAARGSAVTWLLTLVHSRALDLLRHRASQPSVAGTEGAATDLPGDPADDPAERLWRQQAGTRLHAALEHLTPPERWVLGLAYFRELTHTEIAHCTGLPLGTVKSHVQRAQTKLRAALAA